jgi:hypothetical protein
MTDAAERYERLHEVLSDARQAGDISSEADDVILEAMDELWWRMTKDERLAFEGRLRKE